MAGAFGRARTSGVGPPFNLRFLAKQKFHRDRKTLAVHEKPVCVHFASISWGLVPCPAVGFYPRKRTQVGHRAMSRKVPMGLNRSRGSLLRLSTQPTTIAQRGRPVLR